MQFFIQPDKNPAQVRREILAKSLQKHLQNTLPTSQVWIRKSTGTILVDKRPLVSVKVLSESSAELSNWNDSKLLVLKIEKPKLAEEFQKLVAEVLQSYS